MPESFAIRHQEAVKFRVQEDNGAKWTTLSITTAPDTGMGNRAKGMLEDFLQERLIYLDNISGNRHDSELAGPRVQRLDTDGPWDYGEKQGQCAYHGIR